MASPALIPPGAAVLTAVLAAVVLTLQSSSGVLPSFSFPWGFSSPQNSDTPLPVISVEQPADTAPQQDTPAQDEAWATHQQQQQQRRQKNRRQSAREPVREQVPVGCVSQPLPAVFSEPSHGSFAFFRKSSLRPRQAPDPQQLASREGSVADSVSHRSNSSSGRLPSFLSGLRQGSLSMRVGSFDREPSWTGSGGRQGSQTGVGSDHAWFV